MQEPVTFRDSGPLTPWRRGEGEPLDPTRDTLQRADSTDGSDASRWRAPFVFVVALLATSYPPLAILAKQGVAGAFRYFAADAFYYLAVADRSMAAPFFTFDGSHPTNGFHPLWQLYLHQGFRLLGLHESGQIWFAALSSIALTSLGTALFALALLRLTKRPALALLGAVPGFYYLMVPAFSPHYEAQWSFANGMESPLSIFLFGALACALFQGGLGRGLLRRTQQAAGLLVLSALLTLVTLARLDDIFLFVPFLAWIVLAAPTRRDGLSRAATAALIPTVVIGGYLLYNQLYAGSLLPSSGMAKASGWLFALLRNTYGLLTTTAPFADPLGREHPAWNHEAWRIAQMVVPAAAACWWLLREPMRGAAACEIDADARQRTLVGMLAVYVLLKAAYNFAFVSLWNQGHWYYPLSIMVFNLMVAVGAARLLDARRAGLESDAPAAALLARWPGLARLPLATAASIFVVLVSANAFVNLKQTSDYHSQNYAFWKERVQVQRLLDDNCKGCGLVAFDDGIVSYSLKAPTMNGLGLALDREASRAREHGELLSLAWQRGHRMLVSVNYAMPDEAYSGRRSLLQHLLHNPQLREQPLEGWNFEVAFESPESHVRFVRFSPKPSGLARARLQPPAVPASAPIPATPMERSRRDG